MEIGTTLYTLTHVSYGEVMAVTSSMEIMLPLIQEELYAYDNLSEEDVDQIMQEGSYEEYFTVDSGTFLG